jgi:hypothetical protein
MILPYYCGRCGATDDAGVSAHRCTTIKAITNSPAKITNRITNAEPVKLTKAQRAAAWNKTNREAYNERNRDRMKAKREAEKKAKRAKSS